MATKAYFLIKVAKELNQNGYQEAVRELEAIPEVRSIETVVGECDLMVQIEAPIRVILTADKVLAKEWVRHLSILKVEPFEFGGVSNNSIARGLLEAQIASARKGQKIQD